MVNFRRIILGRRLASDETQHTKISNKLGLAIFSSDALSSVAYATQEILASLSSHSVGVSIISTGAAIGIITPHLAVPVAIGIVILLMLLAVSYKQTIMEYPNGGGAYTVAKENLGEIAAQTAGISLLIGYILTVAVSVSSGIAAIMATGKEIHSPKTNVYLALLSIVFIAIMNLRGVKESGRLFAIPTYGFIVCVITILGIGCYKWLFGTALVAVPSIEPIYYYKPALIWIIMCAFSAGCTALTGVEAISNGVTAFKEPASKNAAKTLVCMVLLLGVMFLGVTLLSNYYNISYTNGSGEAEPVLSLLTRKIIGYDRDQPTSNLIKLCYYVIQGFTFAILIVAANTAYAGFPRLAVLHAKDGFLPKQFASVGDRLVLSNGIVILSILAGLLVVKFQANTSRLLPLYALGVFLGFTLSQVGMIVHWYKKRGRHWQLKLIINGTGGLASALVMVNIAVTKAKDGAWIIIILIPMLVSLFFKIHRHYIRVKSTLAASRTDAFLPSKHHAIVLVSTLHAGVVQALSYARLISGDRVEAITVDLGSDGFHESPAIQKLRADWLHYGMGVPLRSIPSPYRRIVEPIWDEIDRIRLAEPEVCLTIILPEFFTTKWWYRIIHNQMAFRIKTMLMTKPGVIVTSVRTHLNS